MDAFLIAFSIVFGMLSLVVVVGSDSEGDFKVFKWACSFFLGFLAIFVWAVVANVYHNPTPIVLERPIEELRNVPFYFNENDKPVEITGDARFADPKNTVVHIKTFPGGWKFGMYVTETRKVEFIKKPSVEK